MMGENKKLDYCKKSGKGPKARKGSLYA